MPVRWLAHEVEAWEVSEGSRWSTAKDQPNPVSVSGVTARLNDRGLGSAKPFKASSHKELHEQARHTTYVDGPRLARVLDSVLIGSLAVICPACWCSRT